MVEDLAHGSEIIDEGDDAHLTVADRALQRKSLVDARQQHRPQIPGHGTMAGLFAGRRRSRRWRDGGRSERRHHSAQLRIGREHTIVAMTMRTRWRHQRGDLVDQFEWCQHQRRRTCAGRCSTHRLGIAIDQMLGIALV